MSEHANLTVRVSSSRVNEKGGTYRRLFRTSLLGRRLFAVDFFTVVVAASSSEQLLLAAVVFLGSLRAFLHCRASIG